MIVREDDPPLGEAVHERPPRAEWMAVWERALEVPVPAYEGRPVWGLIKPRRDHG